MISAYFGCFWLKGGHSAVVQRLPCIFRANSDVNVGFRLLRHKLLPLVVILISFSIFGVKGCVTYIYIYILVTENIYRKYIAHTGITNFRYCLLFSEKNVTRKSVFILKLFIYRKVFNISERSIDM